MANNIVVDSISTNPVVTTVDLTSFGGYPSTGELPASCIFVGTDPSVEPTPLSNANPLPVGGTAAAGFSDIGNPVKIGGVYNASPPTYTTGQRGDAQLDAAGNLKVNVVVGGGGSSNPAASGTGLAIPAFADFTGVNVGGNLRGRTGVNITGSVYAAQTDMSSVGGAALAFGQAVMASSIPVTIASNQSSIPIAQGTAAALSGFWPVRITDGTNSCPTMDATARPGFQKITDGQTVASVSTPGTKKALFTNLTDGTNVTVISAGGALSVDGSAVTQPVSLASQPLPTGASTEATLAKLAVAQSAALGSNTNTLMGGSVTTAAPTYTTGNINPLSLTTSGLLRVDTSGTTSPISGTVTANAGTGTFAISGTVTANAGTGTLAVSAASLPLPTGAATETTLAKTAIPLSTALGSNTQTLMGGSVTTAAPTYTTGNINPLSLTTAGALRTDASATTQPVSAASLPLPTGASTSAKQPALGTAGAASADVLSVQGVASMTALKVDGSAVTQPVSGTVTANAGTGTMTVTFASQPLPTGASTEATLAKLAVSQSTALGSNTNTLMGGSVTTAAPTYTTGNINPLSLTTSGLLRVDTSGTTSPVSGTITANAGTGTFIVGGNVASGASDSGNPVKVGGVFLSSPPTLTNAQRGDFQVDSNGNLKVNVITGGGSGSNAAASATGSAVPASADYGGLNVAGNLRGQTGVNVTGVVYAAQMDLTSVGGTAVALGQTTMSASLPVTIASNQATFPVSQGTAAALSGFWPVRMTDGTNSMPTMDSTGRSGYQHITDGTNTMAVSAAGTKKAAYVTITDGTNSAVVSATGVISVDGSSVTQPISAASLPLPAGAATSAKQPALGTAGSASTDVITIQGIASGTAIIVADPDTTNSGSLAATGSVSISPVGESTWIVQITGTWVGTVTFEGSVDGTNFVSLSGSPLDTGTLTQTTTGNGIWRGNAAALQTFRARVSTYVSGTAVISVRSSANSGATPLSVDAMQTGVVFNGLTPITPLFALISCSSSGDNTIVSLTSGKKIRVLSYIAIGASAVNLTWKSSVAGAISGAMPSPIAKAESRLGHFETTVSEALVLNLGTAVAVGGHLCYILV